MPLKHWILHGVNRMNAVVGRSDLKQRAPAREPTLRDGPEVPASPVAEHLGAYAPLVAAIRDELEHFVTTHLRLHLAIAERDRYLLTSIEVECVDGSDGMALLDRFTREFTPEQIKRFLARDVIGPLRNASAIDLSQFGGLNATHANGGAAEGEDDYAALVAELKSGPSETPRSFEVELLGRWIETDAPSASKRGDAVPATPLAGRRLEIDIEDADGARAFTLAATIPNRRYAIGKGEGSDITVNGRFTSRRHCEIWLENGSWWAADAGSRNGIRLESAQGVLGRSGGQSPAAAAKAAIEIVPKARIVLSAHGEGTPAEYPRITLRQNPPAGSMATPLGPGQTVPTTPSTPIAAAQPRTRELDLTASMASGARTLVLGDDAMPIEVGRSRNQDLVVDWSHEGVSGHHLDIVGFDDTGADVEVHGDNGVTVDGVAHAVGQRFRWRLGSRMTLGRASSDEPECTLTLSARS